MSINCWSCAVGEVPCTFGAFIPFLQLAFGVNMLFGAWNGIYDSLTKSQEKSKDSDDNLLARVDAAIDEGQVFDELRKKSQVIREWFRRLGRTIGLLFAIMIAVALLLISEETKVCWQVLIVVALMGGMVPVLMLIMVTVDYYYRKKVQNKVHKIARKVSNAAANGQRGAIQVANSLNRNNQ